MTEEVTRRVYIEQCADNVCPLTQGIVEGVKLLSEQMSRKYSAVLVVVGSGLVDMLSEDFACDPWFEKLSHRSPMGISPEKRRVATRSFTGGRFI